MITLADVRKAYAIGEATVEVLKGITLTIEKGEMLSIVGPSGCGKSTLMNILGFLDVPSSGQYLFKDKETSHYSDNELSRIRNKEIGFIFQQFHLLPRLTAVENAALPLVYRGLAERERLKRATACLERVGLGDKVHHKPNELSGGQQQRVAIARVLAAEPSLILADEPTGALDSQVGQDVMNLFLDLNRNEGISEIIITHDSSIARQCTRQVRMADGLLVENGGAR